MAGGLLNLVSEGNQNVFLTGNPSKTFFKSVYKKYTNFGLQTLRIDYSGQRYLNLETDSVFSFKIPRYAELLMDTYLVINLPDIWSPICRRSRKRGKFMRIKRLIIAFLIGIISTNVYSTYSVDQKTTSADINGVSIAYTTSGNKEDPTVLMIMGLMASHKVWG